MKKVFNTVLLICILLSLLVQLQTYAQNFQQNDLFGNANDWALPELKDAYEQELIPENLLYQDLTISVTRGEFAAIAVKLYEKLIDQNTEYYSSAFTDIKGNKNSVYIEKAHTLGIVAGVNETMFAPDSFITREQLATMLCRVFKKYTYKDWTPATDEEYPLLYRSAELFIDDEQISDYAKEAVYFLRKHAVIYGMEYNTFSTNHEADYATREQAVLLSLRCLSNLFNDEVVNYSRYYPSISKSNKLPNIYKFVIDSPEDLEEVVLYDNINYLKISSANITDFSFLKDIDIELLQIICNEQHPIDLKYINSDAIRQLYFHNIDLVNTEVISTFDNLLNFVLINSVNKPEIDNLDFLSKCVNLENIEIQNYGITNLDFAKNMTELVNLSVINSSIEDISGISNCINLTTLKLERGKIKDISAIKNLENLTYLAIKDNYIENIDVAFELMDDSLSYLDASENYISKINIPFASLPEINVDLSKNYITEFPEQLLTVYYADLSYNNIREVPQNIKSSGAYINLFDNLLDEATIREIAESNYIFFDFRDIDDVVAFNNKIKDIMSQVESGTEYEKVIKITKYVTDNIKLDFYINDPEKDNAYGALFEKVVCTGSTELTNALLRHAGIKVKTYHGDILPLSYERHVWSLVCIDGNYYHCDAMQSIVNIDEYGLPRIVLLTDDEITEYGFILDALNAKEATNSVKDIYMASFINNK